MRDRESLGIGFANSYDTRSRLSRAASACAGVGSRERESHLTFTSNSTQQFFNDTEFDNDKANHKQADARHRRGRLTLVKGA